MYAHVVFDYASADVPPEKRTIHPIEAQGFRFTHWIEFDGNLVFKGVDRPNDNEMELSIPIPSRDNTTESIEILTEQGARLYLFT